MDAVSNENLLRRYYSLSADTMLIAGRVARGESNVKIIKWSGNWKFSPEKINKAIEQICQVFDLNHLDDHEKREAITGIYWRVHPPKKY